MSTRGLAIVALGLGLVCAATGWLTVERLGLLEEYDAVGVDFENRMLSVERARRVVIRPMQQGVPEVRYWFGPRFNEPTTDDPVCKEPHIRVGLEDRKPDEDDWHYVQVQFFALAQLGAMSLEEWLEEIRPVRQLLPGGGEKIVMCAVYGHESGAKVFYYHDPANPVPGFGWYRHEAYAQGAPQQVYFAVPAN